jgi:hypothetical protein
MSAGQIIAQENFQVSCSAIANSQCPVSGTSENRGIKRKADFEGVLDGLDKEDETLYKQVRLNDASPAPNDSFVGVDGGLSLSQDMECESDECEPFPEYGMSQSPFLYLLLFNDSQAL